MPEETPTPTPILEERPEPTLNESDPKTISDRYVVIDRLGEGGMGTVYLANDPVVDRDVAVKVLRFKDSTGDLLKRFQQEARAVARLNHPCIITALDFGLMDGDTPFLVMEHIAGETLDTFLKTNGRLSQSEFELIFEQIVDAMNHAHSHGVVHRDLKPSNILIARSDQELKAYVLDFGIAKSLYDSGSQVHTKTGQVIGSPRFASPEQVSGETVDARSDIYSLGCVMFESLTGSPPFQGKTSVGTLQMHLNQSPPALADRIDNPPEHLETLIAKMLAKKPDDRFQGMQDVLSSMLDFDLSDDAGQDNSGTPAIEDGVDTANLPNSETSLDWFGSKRSSIVPLVVVLSLIAAVGLVYVCTLIWPAASGDSVLNKPMPGSILDFDFEELASGGIRYEPEHGFWTSVDSRDITEKSIDLLLKQNKKEPVTRLHLPKVKLPHSAYAKLEQLPLVFLVLTQSNVDDESLKHISRIATLRTVHISGCVKVTDRGIEYLAKLPLHSLELKGVQISDKTLALLSGCKGLTRLITNSRKITSAGVKHLASLKMLGALQISYTEPVKSALPDILSFPALKHLFIPQWKFTERDVDLLAKSSKLVSLNINRSTVNDRQLLKILRMPNLTELSIVECSNLSRDQVAEIGGRRSKDLRLITKY